MIFNPFISVNNHDFRASCSEVWTAFFARFDWLLKPGIAIAIHLRATRAKIVIVDRNKGIQNRNF